MIGVASEWSPKRASSRSLAPRLDNAPKSAKSATALLHPDHGSPACPAHFFADSRIPLVTLPSPGASTGTVFHGRELGHRQSNPPPDAATGDACWRAWGGLTCCKASLHTDLLGIGVSPTHISGLQGSHPRHHCQGLESLKSLSWAGRLSGRVSARLEGFEDVVSSPLRYIWEQSEAIRINHGG